MWKCIFHLDIIYIFDEIYIVVDDVKIRLGANDPLDPL